ncbi:MAG TPA: type II toxin-antitoxin system PemK/MazF family toxin [Candidatus Limnocylindria bacterium]|nr:type II toxin-antitoxin system PemK/MazF family toxin [Candidatus Limnocylindria bacterium]
MRRGDIYSIDFEPVRGSDSDKRRPAVIVSNDAANITAQRLGRGVITVVPLTTSVERIYPFQVLMPASEVGTERDSKAQAEQVRAVSVGRLGARLGIVPSRLMRELDEALRLHLAL